MTDCLRRLRRFLRRSFVGSFLCCTSALPLGEVGPAKPVGEVLQRCVYVKCYRKEIYFMGQLRMERVQELMKQEISKIILEDVKDPRVGFVTVTRVSVTSDLRSARVFVSLMGSDEQMANSLRGLNRSLGFIRREVGHRVRLRYTPELSLELDDSMAYSAHIQELLLRVQKEEAEKGGEPA